MISIDPAVAGAVISLITLFALIGGGFFWLGKLSNRVGHLENRVDQLADEMREMREEMRNQRPSCSKKSAAATSSFCSPLPTTLTMPMANPSFAFRLAPSKPRP